MTNKLATWFREQALGAKRRARAAKNKIRDKLRLPRQRREVQQVAINDDIQGLRTGEPLEYVRVQKPIEEPRRQEIPTSGTNIQGLRTGQPIEFASVKQLHGEPGQIIPTRGNDIQGLRTIGSDHNVMRVQKPLEEVFTSRTNNQGLRTIESNHEAVRVQQSFEEPRLQKVLTSGTNTHGLRTVEPQSVPNRKPLEERRFQEIPTTRTNNQDLRTVEPQSVPFRKPLEEPHFQEVLTSGTNNQGLQTVEPDHDINHIHKSLEERRLQDITTSGNNIQGLRTVEPDHEISRVHKPLEELRFQENLTTGTNNQGLRTVEPNHATDLVHKQLEEPRLQAIPTSGPNVEDHASVGEIPNEVESIQVITKRDELTQNQVDTKENTQGIRTIETDLEIVRVQEEPRRQEEYSGEQDGINDDIQGSRTNEHLEQVQTPREELTPQEQTSGGNAKEIASIQRILNGEPTETMTQEDTLSNYQDDVVINGVNPIEEQGLVPFDPVGNICNKLKEFSVADLRDLISRMDTSVKDKVREFLEVSGRIEEIEEESEAVPQDTATPLVQEKSETLAGPPLVILTWKVNPRPLYINRIASPQEVPAKMMKKMFGTDYAFLPAEPHLWAHRKALIDTTVDGFLAVHKTHLEHVDRINQAWFLLNRQRGELRRRAYDVSSDRFAFQQEKRALDCARRDLGAEKKKLLAEHGENLRCLEAREARVNRDKEQIREWWAEIDLWAAKTRRREAALLARDPNSPTIRSVPISSLVSENEEEQEEGGSWLLQCWLRAHGVYPSRSLQGPRPEGVEAVGDGDGEGE
ncbi:hypothetical protein EDC01DRAFT_632075 [Geopyxis carbonaria]|nr:hypothetical protein EDC01DRAFT_632075 [Geopyxis carbonaria]